MGDCRHKNGPNLLNNSAIQRRRKPGRRSCGRAARVQARPLTKQELWQPSRPQLECERTDVLFKFLNRLLCEMPKRMKESEDPKLIVSSIADSWRREHSLKWAERQLTDAQLHSYYQTIDGILQDVDRDLQGQDANLSYEALGRQYMAAFQARASQVEEKREELAKMARESKLDDLKGVQLNEPTQGKAPAMEINVDLASSQVEAPVSVTPSYALKFATIPFGFIGTMYSFISIFPQVLDEGEIDKLLMAATEMLGNRKGKKQALQYIRHATVLQHVLCVGLRGLERCLTAISTPGTGWKAEFDDDVKKNFRKVCTAAKPRSKRGKSDQLRFEEPVAMDWV